MALPDCGDGKTCQPKRPDMNFAKPILAMTSLKVETLVQQFWTLNLQNVMISNKKLILSKKQVILYYMEMY